ncbi:hypothetical protein [Aliivibrio fischeri]|uniref:hypothetical protein n=1 Tax=Aliivibrio fischeri TaxID=668 RepID=UPI0002FE00EE|nr:hypothetical protein [Aliivibrio fischeri]OEE10166.1 hypothetical protein A1Q3_10830 [Aliivibrio fischeri ZF-211]
MTDRNTFTPILVLGTEYPIAHLKDLKITLCIEFSNGDSRDITIHTRPTNHLYSRAVSNEDKLNKAVLISEGSLLRSYVHREGNYQAVVDEPLKIKEERVFCIDKWRQSYLFPSFVTQVQENYSQVSVLANKGDEKTCLSALLTVPEYDDHVYLVFFHLHKVNSKEVNMMIESAFLVERTAHKAQKLITPKSNEAKPFVVIVKNILENRKPFESIKQSKSKYKRKKKQKQKK